MGVKFRHATPADQTAIRAVHVAAFPTPVEAGLVEQLARDGDVVLSLLAEDASGIVGHILMSRMKAEGDGHSFRAVGLAPVAVVPKRQKQGIGAGLIREALGRMRGQGEELVFLVGEPDYYRRFDFDAVVAARFASPYAGPYFMALALGEMALPQAGRADYAPAFAGLE